MRRLRHRLGLKGFAGFISDGLSGGLALFGMINFLLKSKILMRDILMRMSVSLQMHLNGALLVSMANHVWKIVITCGINYAN
jgi:hypothetical protein